MIQFLNIAGLGPIFGAIMGAQFGTASFLWIVFGTIFAGAVHDFFAGTISIRNGGESLTQTIRRYLGSKVNWVMIFLTVLLMLLVVAVQHIFLPHTILFVVEIAGQIGIFSPLNNIHAAGHIVIKLMIAQGCCVVTCGIHKGDDALALIQ